MTETEATLALVFIMGAATGIAALLALCLVYGAYALASVSTAILALTACGIVLPSRAK